MSNWIINKEGMLNVETGSTIRIVDKAPESYLSFLVKNYEAAVVFESPIGGVDAPNDSYATKNQVLFASNKTECNDWIALYGAHKRAFSIEWGTPYTIKAEVGG